MTNFSREARLAAIATQRERFSVGISLGDRASVADAILAEAHLLLDDAWVRTVAASAFAPGVLGAMVRSGRLSFEHLRECLDADPRWTEGIAALVGALDDDHAAMLDATLDSPTDVRARDTVRMALLFGGRRGGGRVSVEELLAIGWSSVEALVSRDVLPMYAAEVYARRSTVPEPSLFDLSELASMLVFVAPSLERDESLRTVIARIEAILDERAADDTSAEVRVAWSDLVRAWIALGERSRADRALDRLAESVDVDDSDDVELLFSAHRPLLDACTGEERSAREAALVAKIPRDCTVRLWRVAHETLAHWSPDLRERLDASLDEWLARIDSLDEIERVETFSQVAMGAKLFSSSTVERYVERLSRHVRGSSTTDVHARVMLEFVRENSASARSFVERTASQQTIAWWEDPAVYSRLARSTLGPVLDGALRAHRPRWPAPTVDALRWVSRDLSSASAQKIDALVGSAPVEQRAERALFAIGRAILRLGDRARDTESSRVAAKLAVGEFAESSAFDRVWWELGETAQRSAWLARPTRADRVGWLVPKRVIETLAGVECAERYAKMLDQWIERTARACGAR